CAYAYGRASLPPRPAGVEDLGLRGDDPRPDDRGRAGTPGRRRVAKRARGPLPARGDEGPNARRRARRAGAVPPRTQRWNRGPERGSADRPRGCAPAWWPDPSRLRRLGGEPPCPRTIRRLPLPNGSACGVALV